MSPLFEAGLDITAIGMGVVIVLLTLLVYIVRGMSSVCHKLEGATRSTAEPAAPVGASLSNHELVGVISAAIVVHRRRHGTAHKRN